MTLRIPQFAVSGCDLAWVGDGMAVFAIGYSSLFGAFDRQLLRLNCHFGLVFYQHGLKAANMKFALLSIQRGIVEKLNDSTMNLPYVSVGGSGFYELRC